MEDVKKYPLAVLLDKSRFDFSQARTNGADMRCSGKKTASSVFGASMKKETPSVAIRRPLEQRQP